MNYPNIKVKIIRYLRLVHGGGKSTILWASVCKKYDKGKVFCIDTWGASENAPKLMKEAIKKDKIMKLFLHNVNASGLKDYIVSIRGTSDDVAEILKTNGFDFIYIDGCHAYSQFKRDLVNYSKICKTNGIICGDDLEVDPREEINWENAEKHKEEDCIKDTNLGVYFHPGIALAIKEYFGEKVSILNGFWAIRKSKEGWNKLSFEV